MRRTDMRSATVLDHALPTAALLPSFAVGHLVAWLMAVLCSPRGRSISGERIHDDGGLRRAY